MLRRTRTPQPTDSASANRIKTLFDALRAPTIEELPDPNPPGEGVVCCLLEDDSLITGFEVEADQLLGGEAGGGQPINSSHVRLVIQVTVKNAQSVMGYGLSTCSVPLHNDPLTTLTRSRQHYEGVCEMKALRLLCFIVIANVMYARTVSAEDVRTWASGLTCSDLVTTDGQISTHYEQFQYWLQGFMTGVSALSPVDLVSNMKFSEFSALVLTYCTKEQNLSAIDASLDASELLINASHGGKRVKLKAPGEPR